MGKVFTTVANFSPEEGITQAGLQQYFSTYSRFECSIAHKAVGEGPLPPLCQLNEDRQNGLLQWQPKYCRCFQLEQR